MHSIHLLLSQSITVGPGYGPYKLLPGDPQLAGRFSICTSYSIATISDYETLTPLLIPPRLSRSPASLSLPPTSSNSSRSHICLSGQWPATAIYPYYRPAPIHNPAHWNFCHWPCNLRPASTSTDDTTPSFVSHRHSADRSLHPRGTGIVRSDWLLRPPETPTTALVAVADSDSTRRRKPGLCIRRVRRFDMGHTS